MKANPTYDALFAVVCKDNDPTLRLILADWCEANEKMDEAIAWRKSVEDKIECLNVGKWSWCVVSPECRYLPWWQSYFFSEPAEAWHYWLFWYISHAIHQFDPGG